MHPIFNRGFLAETLACLFLAAAGFALGWSVAMDLIGALAEMVGIGAVMMTSPADGAFISLKLAFAGALPGAVSWVALLIHRGRVQMRAPRPLLAAIMLGPWLVGIVAETIRAQWMASVIASSATYGVETMISVGEFAPGGWASRAILGSGLLLWVAVFWFTGRSAAQAGETLAAD